MSSSGREEGRKEGQDFTASVVEEACKEVFGRTGGAGLPVFSNARDDSQKKERFGESWYISTQLSQFGKRELQRGRCGEVVEEEEKWGGGMYQQF